MTAITNSEKVGLAFAKLLGFMALLAASSVWKGYVLSILWGWFMVRAFGLPPLSIPLAIGVGLVVSFLTYRMRSETEKTSALIWFATAMPALYLLVGWIVTKFL